MTSFFCLHTGTYDPPLFLSKQEIVLHPP